MIKVEFFGNYRLIFKAQEIEIEANSIGEMLDIISSRYNQLNKQEIVNATLFVNDKAVQGMFRNRKKLNDGDRVLMMYPSCGG